MEKAFHFVCPRGADDGVRKGLMATCDCGWRGSEIYDYANPEPANAESRKHLEEAGGWGTAPSPHDHLWVLANDPEATPEQVY